METIINPVVKVDAAFIYIIGFSLFLLFAITVTMVWFVFRYSRKRHPKAADIRGDWRLELVWTLVPTLIALSMFWIGWSSYAGLRNVPDNALTIEAVAMMYSWIFIYPNEKETEDELVVPQGKPVRLEVTSDDVIHGLFIPAFRIKVDAVPGVHTYAWFLPDEVGTYFIQCSEFCGVGHADMTAVLRVVTGEEYLAWLETGDDDDE